MSEIPEQRWVWRASLWNVVDGDTFDLWIDQGFHSHKLERVRLLFVDTPEMKKPTLEAGREAKAFALEWLMEAEEFSGLTADWPPIIETSKSDSFGRYLGDIWRVSDGSNLGSALILAGHAENFDGRR